MRRFRTLRSWWRWLSDETGSPWMAALVAAVLFACVGYTLYVAKQAAAGTHYTPRRAH